MGVFVEEVRRDDPFSNHISSETTSLSPPDRTLAASPAAPPPLRIPARTRYATVPVAWRLGRPRLGCRASAAAGGGTCGGWVERKSVCMSFYLPVYLSVGLSACMCQHTHMPYANIHIHPPFLTGTSLRRRLQPRRRDSAASPPPHRRCARRRGSCPGACAPRPCTCTVD